MERQAGAELLGGGWGCGPFWLLSEPEKLKRLDRLGGELRQLQKRLDDWSSFERLSFAEQYGCGRLALACYFESSATVLNQARDPALLQSHRKISETIVTCLIVKADASEFLHRHSCDQKVMFVEVVEGADRPKTKVASVVDAYLVDKQDGKFGQGFLYNSVRGMGARIVPVLCNRERDLISPFPEYGDHRMVEGASQVVNDIANDKRNLGWRRAKGRDLNQLVSGLRITLHDQTAELRLEESSENRFKLLDVAVGPLNL